MKTLNHYIYQLVTLLLISLPLLTACTDEPDVPEPKECSRTVLVYMVAANNLGTGGYDRQDLSEMQRAANAGDLGDGRLLVYHHPSGGAMPMLKEVKAGGIDTLKVYDTSLTSVSSNRMLEVFDDMRQLAPASDYGLVMWSHASGWLQDGEEDSLDTPADNSDMVMPMAFGQDNGRHTNLTTLGRTLEGQNFSFVYFDCCYMGAIEVAYELRHATPMIVGSPSEISATGMPYDRNLKYLFADEPALVDAARTTFGYYDDMSGSSRSCTMTVLNTASVVRLARAVKAIYEAASGPMPASYNPQAYMTERHCYHFDLAHYIHALTDDVGLLSEFDDALAATVLYEDATPYLWSRLEILSHCGLSTFIFADRSESQTKNYHTTSWYIDVASSLLKD